jgi:UDP-3-O-[3-hydroxymyristoyl] glucosamine N-acyltransferase
MDFPKPLQVKEVAELIKAKVIGNTSYMAHGLNELHVVRPGDITFVDHPKYYTKVLESQASIVIINKETDVPEGKVLLYHEAPFDAFQKLILHFRPFVQSTQAINPTAKIGVGTIIQPGVFVGANVSIGNNCLIHANVSIYDNSVIGNNVIIHSGSVIGSDGYYFQKRKEGYVKFNSGGRVILEDHVEIGACCTIDKGVTADTTIGWGTKTDNHCQIGHDTIIGKNCLIGAFAAIAGVTQIEDDVILWAKVAVNKDVVIGKGAVIMATSATERSLEGGKVYMGAPAMDVKRFWRISAALKELPEFMREMRRKN